MQSFISLIKNRNNNKFPSCTFHFVVKKKNKTEKNSSRIIFLRIIFSSRYYSHNVYIAVFVLVLPFSFLHSKFNCYTWIASGFHVMDNTGGEERSIFLRTAVLKTTTWGRKSTIKSIQDVGHILYSFSSFEMFLLRYSVFYFFMVN